MIQPPLARILTGEATAVEGEAVEWSKDGGGNLFGTEEFPGEGLHVFTSDSFDGGENLIEREEAAEIELLAREIGHAGAGGLERKHERALEMILGAKKLF